MSLLPVGTRVEITTTCPMNRWQAGEKGTLLRNDYDKYHYKVKFDTQLPPTTIGFLGETRVARVFYFYDDELKAENG